MIDFDSEARADITAHHKRCGTLPEVLHRVDEQDAVQHILHCKRCGWMSAPFEVSISAIAAPGRYIIPLTGPDEEP